MRANVFAVVNVNRPSRLFRVVGASLSLILSIASALSAQQVDPQAPGRRPAASSNAQSGKPGKWQFEVHGGQFLDGQTAGGSGSGIASFPAGTPFTTVNGSPSRAVSSWAYGDGATLFDEVRRSFAANLGLTLPAVTPLDSVMRTRGIVREAGPAFGARFSRDLTSWLALEFAVDRGANDSLLAGSVTSGLEATRASYVSAFEALLASIPQNGGRVTSTKAVSSDGSAQQTTATASAVLRLVRSDRVGVHATIGGGYVTNSGRSTLDVTLDSGYRFSVFSTFPINESESVTISFAEKKSMPAVALGLGFTIRVAGQSGLRVDARVLATQNRAVTTVSSSNAQVIAAQLISFPSLTTPSIQFNTVSGNRTTLSGGPVTNLVTYEGDGFDLRPHVTVGYYVRF